MAAVSPLTDDATATPRNETAPVAVPASAMDWRAWPPSTELSTWVCKILVSSSTETLVSSTKPDSSSCTLIGAPFCTRESVMVKILSGLVPAVVDEKLKVVSSPNLRFRYLVASAARVAPVSTVDEFLR